MDDDTKAEWLALGERLLAANADKFSEVERGMRDLIEAQEIIARFDGQLFFRGRPKKRYHA